LLEPARNSDGGLFRRLYLECVADVFQNIGGLTYPSVQQDVNIMSAIQCEYKIQYIDTDYFYGSAKTKYANTLKWH